jgi:hypothetical protein
MAKKINLTKEQIEAAAKAGREKTEKAYAQKAQAIAKGYGTNSAKSKVGKNRGQLPEVSEVLARNNPAFAALQQAGNAKKLTKGSDAISYGKKSSERKPGQISALGAGDYGASKTTRFDATANAAIYSTAGAFSNLFGLLKEKDAQTKARDAADSARLKAGYDAMLNGEDINTREGGLKKQHEDSQKAFERGYAALAGAGQKNFDTADELAARSNEYQQIAKEGLGKFGQGVVDFGIAGLQFAGDAAMNAILPGSGLVAMGMRAAGSGAQEARNNGLDINDQFTSGLKSAAIEVLTEKLFGAASKVAYGKGIIRNESLVNGLVNRLAKTDKGRTALKVIVGANEEGLEEVLSDILNPVADRVLKLDDGKGDWSDLGEDMDAEQMLEDYIIGSTLGLFGAGTNVISGQYRAENAQQRAYENYQRELVNAGIASEQGSQAQLTAAEYQNILDNSAKRGNRNLSDKETANLEQLITAERDTPAVRNALERSGTLVDDNTATVIAKAASGQKLTRAEQSIIDSSPVMQQAVNTMTGSGAVANIRTTATKNSVVNSMAERYTVSPEVISRTYDLAPVESPEAFEMAFDAVYQMGQQGANKESLIKVPVLNRAQAEIAYNMGASTTQAAVDNAAVQGDNVSTQVNNQINTQEVNENGVRLRDSGQRLNGQNTEGQIPSVERGAVEAYAGTDSGRQSGYSAAQGKTGQKVVYNGVEQENVYYSGEDTESMKKGRELARSYGYNVTYFEGGNIKGSGGEFRGMVDTESKTVMVRSDHPDISAEQIMRHEMGHAAIAQGDISLDELRSAMLSDLSEKELNSAVEVYRHAYGDTISKAEAFEEMCCDALGKINIFAGTEHDSANYGKVQESFRKHTAETANKGRAPPKSGVMFSRQAEDKYFARQIDQWDGKDHGGAFRVGGVSEPLLKVGIPNTDIWFDQSKAAKQLLEKGEITKSVIKQIPEILQHPIAISESYDNTVMVFGQVFDANGNPIVVALRVNSTKRRNSITLVNKIRSVGSRSHNLDKLLNDSNILYLGENKKETKAWFNALGRSTPFGGTKFGLIRSVSFADAAVKKFSMEAPIEQKKNLIALHNLDETKLLKTLKLGGFPMPSIAITKSDIPHTNFGNITVVFGKETVDPKFDRRNTVYSADAWTPLFPRMEYEANEKAAQRIRRKYYELEKKHGHDFVSPLYESANYLDDTLTKYGGVEGLIDKFADDTRMMQIYLADTGRTPVESVKTETITRLTDNQIEVYDALINTLGADVLNDMAAKHNEAPFAARKAWFAKHGDALKAAFEQYYTKDGIDAKTAKSVVDAMKPAELIKEATNARKYLKDGAETRKTEVDIDATNIAIRKAVDSGEYIKWLNDLYGDAVKDSGFYNNKDYYTSSGNRRSFKATHYPNTLDGIVKAMASQGDGNSRNVMGFHGVKSLRAGTAERFKSVEDMHKLEGRLKHLTAEEASQISDALDSRLSELMHDIYNLVPHSGYSNELMELDSIGEVFMEATELKYVSPANVKALFKKYNYPLTDKMASDIVALLFDVNNMPVNIFEAKPERVVGFDEIRKVIIPDTSSDTLRKALKEAGINAVEEYRAGDDAARMKIANDVPDAHFSREPESITELRRQNKELKKRVDYWKGQTQRTKVKTVRQSDVNRLAREVIDMSESDLKPQDITERLSNLGEHILNEKELRYTDIAEMAQDIAEDVVSNATTIVNEDDVQTHNRLKDYLKRVKLKDDGSAEFESIRNSYKRRIMFGKNGLSVDSVYAELNSMFGEGYFPEDIINPANQLERIAEVLDGTAPQYANPNGYYAEEAAEYMRNYIIDSMLSNQVRQTAPTMADKAASREAKLKADNAERIKNAVKKERERNEVKLQRFKEGVARLDSKRKETALRNRYKGQIEKNVNTLSKWLLNPDHKNTLKHIPGQLQSTVRDFISAIDFTSSQQLGGGAPTIKDMKYIDSLDRLRRYIADSKVGEDRYSDLDLPPEFETQLADFVSSVNTLARNNKGTYTINDMTSGQLKELSDIVKTMKKAITDMNRLYQNATFQHVYEAGESDIETLREYTKTKAFTSKLAANRLDQAIMWESSRPAHVFKRFGKGGESMYQEFVGGQNTMAFLTKEVIDFAEDTYTTAEVKQWAKETHEFKFGDQRVKLTSAQLMSLYELNKRSQAKQHLDSGGFRVANFKDGKFNLQTDKEKHVFTDAELNEMFGELTDRQKEVADKLQRFMVERGGEWGNYVSRKRFDVEMFKDENYFPIKIDTTETDSKVDEKTDNASLYQLLNMGFTKETSAKANQSIVVYDIFDVFANHMSEMAQYRSFALPLLDMTKWFNIKVRDEGGNVTASLRTEMRRAFGSDKNGRGFAEQFVTGIIKAYNGAEGRGDSSVNSRMINRVNRAAVAYNTRVMIQQPSAIVRAALYLDPKDLISSLKNYAGISTKQNIEEMHKHSGIALWKDLGFYDVNVSRGVQELIKHSQGTISKINEIGMKGAEFADKVTWAALWDASKKQVRRETGLSESDAEFFPKVSKVFENVIYNTQVVDTVLTKSEVSRNRSSGARLFTSFMSEPMTTASLVTSEIFDIQMKQAKGIKLKPSDYSRLSKTCIVVAVAAVINSALASLADAWRDDDEYGTFGQKWTRAMRIKLADELNPLTYFPYASNVWDITKKLLDDADKKWFGVEVYGNGTDIPLTDIINSSLKALEIFREIREKGEDSRYTKFGGYYKVVNVLSKITGIPLYNIAREGVSLYNAFASDKIRSYEPSKEGAVKYAWNDGYLTDDEAIAALQDDAGMDEGEAWLEVEKWKNDTTSNYTKLYDAIDNGGDIKKAVDELTEHGVEEKNIKSSLTRRYKEAYINGDNKEREKIRRALYATGVYGSVNEVIEKCNSWLKK